MRTCIVHELLSEILELALNYDQLDVTNVAAIEQLVRYLQDTELEVKKKQEANSDFSTQQYVLGRHRRTGGAIFSPALHKFVAEQACAESALLREERKAAEARKVAKK